MKQIFKLIFLAPALYFDMDIYKRYFLEDGQLVPFNNEVRGYSMLV